MNLVDDPDETINCPPAACGGCGADLSRAPVTAQRRHQVTDISPAPPPAVTEYVAQAKECASCGTVTAGELPAHVRARASYGPETCAQAGNLVCGHHIPVHRATVLPGRSSFRSRPVSAPSAAPSITGSSLSTLIQPIAAAGHAREHSGPGSSVDPWLGGLERIQVGRAGWQAAGPVCRARPQGLPRRRGKRGNGSPAAHE